MYFFSVITKKLADLLFAFFLSAEYGQIKNKYNEFLTPENLSITRNPAMHLKFRSQNIHQDTYTP